MASSQLADKVAELIDKLIERGQQPVPFTVLINPRVRLAGRGGTS